MERNRRIDQFVAATKAKVIKGEMPARYDAQNDHIIMPTDAEFLRHIVAKPSPHRPRNIIISYYGLLFRQLVHWTGHPTRLHRVLDAPEGTQEAKLEACVAEFGALHLSEHFFGKDEHFSLHTFGYTFGMDDPPKTLTLARLAGRDAVRYLLTIA